jgi:hypothetical protein
VIKACGVGKTTMSDPNIFWLRGASTCGSKNGLCPEVTVEARGEGDNLVRLLSYHRLRHIQYSFNFRAESVPSRR